MTDIKGEPAGKILIIEDDEELTGHEKNFLEHEGFEVAIAHTGPDGWNLYKNYDFDLVVLDLMLTDELSGGELLERIRDKSQIPIIISSALTKQEDRVKYLGKGATDYMVKPFSPMELVYRVKSILSRTKNQAPKKEGIESNDHRIKLYPEDMKVIKDGEEIHMTKNEYLIFKTLLYKSDKAFTREEIISIVFGSDYDGYDRAIDTHIKNIRQKIEDDPKNPKYIETVYGVGYRAGDFHEIS